MVVNLDDCIALTHNYVSLANLTDCLRFLRDTPDQISGIRDRLGEAVRAEDIYEELVRGLRVPEAGVTAEELDRCLEESKRPKGRAGGGGGGLEAVAAQSRLRGRRKGGGNSNSGRSRKVVEAGGGVGSEGGGLGAERGKEKKRRLHAGLGDCDCEVGTSSISHGGGGCSCASGEDCCCNFGIAQRRICSDEDPRGVAAEFGGSGSTFTFSFFDSEEMREEGLGLGEERDG